MAWVASLMISLFKFAASFIVNNYGKRHYCFFLRLLLIQIQYNLKRESLWLTVYTAARNKHCEKLTLCRIRTWGLWIFRAVDRKSKGRRFKSCVRSIFAMVISCSRCSDGSMWLPFW